MGSNSYDPPPPPSYEATEQAALKSYLATQPQYRATAVRDALGANMYKYLGEARLSDEYLDLRTSMEDSIASYNNALFQYGDASNPLVAQTKAEMEAARERLFQYNAKNGVRDEYTIGDLDIAMEYGRGALDLADEQARRQLALRQDIGEATAAQTRKELIAADPEGYARNEALKKQIYGDLIGSTSDTATLRDVLARDRAAYETGDSGLASILADTQAEYALGSRLDASTAREVEQAARNAQASRGNILGIGAAAQEAMSLGSAGEARRQQRLSNYSSAIGAFAADSDRRRTNLLGADTAIYGRNQQAIANKQSYALGSSLTNQFAGLGAAGSGAVNYNPGIGNQSATVANGNAGAQYGLGLYQQQSQNAATAAAQGNPWMNVAAGVAGTGAGAFTGGLGSGLASSMFSSAAGGAGPTLAPSAVGAKTGYWG